jgi:hypothetical protein
MTNSEEVERLMKNGAVWTIATLIRDTGLKPQQVNGVLGAWISKRKAIKVGDGGFRLASVPA